MKKVLVVWLIMTAAGMGFAQNLTFNGMVLGGIGFFKSDHKDSEFVIGHYNSSENGGVLAQLWTHFSNSNNTAGLRLLFRANADFMQDHTNASHFQIETYEGWLRFFDNIVEIRGGKLDYKELYNPYGGVEAAMFNAEGWGMIVNVNPFVGFNTRFGVFPAGGLGQAFNHKQTRYNLSFRYDLFGMANFMLNTVVHHEDLYDIGFGVQVVALRRIITGLSNANFDFAFLNILGNKNNSIGIQIGQRFDYASGNIGAGLRFMQLFVDGREADLTFAGYVIYTLGNIVPRFNFGMNFGSPMRGTGHSGPAGDDLRGGANYYESIHKGSYYDGLSLNPRGGQANAGNLILQPGVQFRIGGNQYIEIGYSLQRDLSTPKSTRTMNNLIYIDYKLEF